jgi:hypothetical protein
MYRSMEEGVHRQRLLRLLQEHGLTFFRESMPPDSMSTEKLEKIVTILEAE